VTLSPDVVLPALRGSFGREYHHTFETATTQSMLPRDAGHGAVALAEHQTAGRGRLGRVWIDEPGAGLSFSVALVPPPPLRRWPELTLVAAEAIVSAIGHGAAIKEPNDVLLGGRKVAGVLAETQGARVVLGIGVNVGSAPWPGAGAAGVDRLELLVGILEALERGYETWAASVTGS
jgi:BirA family transcriptional regulator, biotin operon repressor / biotin---[acetyl-CoA-carboxylase] ligase